MTAQSATPFPFGDLPEGTVTFLFSDIEGSTQLLYRLGDQFTAVLAEHHRILREAVAHGGGQVVRTEGDSFFVAFPRATEAVAAAVEAQRALAQHPWPEGAAVRVRMGLHTGEPEVALDDYVGIAIHRAARIAHVGHGGQVLLSETTTALVQDELPSGVSLLDLGRHLLKDIRRPEHICQLQIEGLSSEFPPLKTLGTLPPEGARLPRRVGACPYRGLAAFREADAPFYCGREAFVELLEQAVRRQALTAVIVGSSGSGKSSALFAGLLPRLRGEGGWQFVLLRPGAQPFYALAGALLPLLEGTLSETGRLAETRNLAERMVKGEVSLVQVVGRIQEKVPETRRILLVVDQFEELYTLCPDARAQQAFIDELLAAAEAGKVRRPSPCVILLTLRADFMGQALAYRPFADALQESSLLMGPMTRQELRMAIEKPAEMQGAAFEAGLVERILDDVGDKPGNLPLLEFTLTLLWERQTDGWLTHTHYEAMGGVEGALAAYADQVYGELEPGEQEQTRRALVQLVRPGEGTEDTRRVATRVELGDKSWKLIQYLADRRLVVTGRDAAGHETAEVVHEALIQRWGRFREWMDADRAFRAWQERLRGNLRQWQESGRDEGALLAGAPLLVAENWLAERAGDLSPVEAGYIQEGQALQARRLKERQRRRQQVVLGLAAGLVLALVFAIAAVALGQQAREKARIATARELTLAALNNLSVDPERSILLALESAAVWSSAGRPVPYDLQDTLHRAVQASRTRLAWPAGDEDILYVGFDRATGRPRVVTANPSAGKVTLWDPEADQALLTLSGRTGPFTDIAVSPDGAWIAVPSDGNAVAIWEIATGQQRRVLAGHSDEILGATFSLDGRMLATYGLAEQIVWEIASGEKLLEFPAPAGENDVVVFSPDGQYVATVAGSQAVSVIEIASGRQMLSREHGYDVVAFAFSPDGKRVASGGRESFIKVWDTASGEDLLTLPIRTAAQVEAMAYSPDGTRLATGGAVWDAASGEELFPLLGHTQEISRLAFSADGTRLITASYDGTIRIWDLTPIHELWTIAGHGGMVYGVAFSPDGKWLATCGADGNAVLWNLASGQAVRTMAGHADVVNGVAFSPDGKLLATASADRAVIVWDSVSGQQLRTLTGHTEDKPGTLPMLRGAVAVAFSPQCTTEGCPLATAGMDGQLIVWEALSGQKLLTYREEIGGLKSVAFSPDGKQLAVGSTGDSDNPVGEAIVLDAGSGAELRRLPGHAGWVWGLAFGPDGKHLATVDFWGTGRVWDVSTGAVLVSLSGPPNGFAVTFSPDGARLATGSGEGNVILWEAASGLPLLSLASGGAPVVGAAFSPDGKFLAAASFDGMARVYAVQPKDLLALARSRLTRPFTLEECQKYLHLESCPVGR